MTKGDLKEEIFEKFINLYIKQDNPRPISSRILKKLYFREIGESTIRLYLHMLSKEGLLINIKSLGRIPSDKGWRYYLENALMKNQKNEKLDELKDFYNLFDALEFLSKKFKVYYFTLLNNTQYEGGWEYILKNEEFNDRKLLLEFIEAIRKLKLLIPQLAKEIHTFPQIFIGKENPLNISCHFSLFFSTMKKKQFCLLSIKRINYPKLFKILKQLQEI